jgi:putative DNA methylase
MSDYPIKSPRKLIEVALPLDAINAACAREKSIRHGHPSTLHLWWARRPLAAARAVIFAQLVNDPGYQQGGGFKYGMNKKDAANERMRLFKIIEDLVLWENTTDEEVLERARAEIRRSWREVCELNKAHPQAAELFNPEKLPALHDPFAGGGAIPLEAHRLGLEAYASDLNPVAVLINKAMIEIPPKFAGRPPVNPEWQSKSKQEKALADWSGAKGLAEDVRYYGAWMREEAQKRIGHLYPPVEITAEMAKERPDLKPHVGQKLTVIAWLWTRTIQCQNPGCRAVMPLISSLVLGAKPGKEAYLNPIVENGQVRFKIQPSAPTTVSDPKKGYKRGTSGIFECAVCGHVTTRDYVAEEAMAGRVKAVQTAVVAEGFRGRIYLPADASPLPLEIPEVESGSLDVAFALNPRDVWCRNFGLLTPRDLFTPRQLAALAEFARITELARERVKLDGVSCVLSDDPSPLAGGGAGALGYSEAIGTYLAFVLEKLVESHSTLCTWSSAPKNELVVSTFRRHALPMTWDFAEANPFADSSGSIEKTVAAISRVLLTALVAGEASHAVQADASKQEISIGKVVSTDPPYYDNVAYADLSDFFYAWLRRTLKSVFPDLFATLAVPKAEELVAASYRHGSNEKAEAFFLHGMTRAMRQIAVQAHDAFPVSIYYAFKQSETESEQGTASTGWETFLGAVLSAGFAITGTWPMRTERESRSIGIGTNSLASSIVIVCRKRPTDAPSISRREFIRELNGVLPEALDEMTKGSGDERSPVAPVDLSQAIIGPGMAVFSKYGAVLEADGSPMSVRTALQLINRFLAEDDFDADTQFCLHWFEQHGWTESVFGEADVLARSKSTSVDAMKEAGVLQSGSGKVRLLKWAEYPTDWDPRTDARTPVWEALHQLIRALKQGGESASGALLAALGGKAEAVRQLAYRLYTLCERLGQADDARAYNELITSWTGIESAASSAPKPTDEFLPGMES